ncbi:MAG: autotransporter assembly complex family protein [Pseudoxanthomonas sp.]
MRLSPLLAAALLTIVGTAQAASTIDKVEIRGLNAGNEVEALMIENINVALSLNDVVGRRQGESRLEYLMTEAKAETREAMEPFGYYSPEISVEAARPGGEDERITVVVSVDKGEPVRVRHSDLSIEGAGGEDRYLKDDLAAFRPQVGDLFDHTTYETSKTQIVRRLADRGYFDADFVNRRVEVTRAEHAADIDLTWASGIRYDMGPTTFHQTYFRQGLLDKLVYWEEGSYFHQGKLDRLRQSLAGLDYFSSIDIQARPEDAVEGQVPIDVTLALAKRDVYTMGVSYGTESGAGVRLGLDRRYVNSRGHKFSTQLDYAQKRKNLVAQYRIPAFKWLDGWYAVAVQAYDEQTDYIDTRLIKFSASRSGEINEYLTATASLNAVRERWAYSVPDDGSGVPPPVDYRYATFTYPELSASYVDVDNRAFARRGIASTMTLRGGLEGAGSDADFAQVHLEARWFKGIGATDRFILRGELGHTFTDALNAMPPSLRYYAGGDRSIRGYQFREVGPRVDTEEGEYSVGAKNVVTASAEYEHYFNGSWGGAVFVDSGSAFDNGNDLDWRTGVGVGVRWKSPVGAVRIDLARGLDDPDSSFTIGLGIGAEF